MKQKKINMSIKEIVEWMKEVKTIYTKYKG